MNRFRRKIDRFTADAHVRAAHVRMALAIVWEAAHWWTVAWAGMLLLGSLLPAALVLLTKSIVDALLVAINTGGEAEAVQHLVILGGAMGGIMLLQQSLQQARTWIQSVQGELVEDHVKRLIHNKAGSVPYGFYESSEYFDQLRQASTQSGSRSLSLIQHGGTVIQSTITFLSIVVIVASYSIWIPFVLLAGTLPAVIVVIRHNRLYHAWWKERTKENRWIYYLDVLFIEPRFAAEMRMYDLGDHFQEEYEQTRDIVREEKLELQRKAALARILAALSGLFVVGLIMVWMIVQAMRGNATPGDIALFYQAINQSQGLIRNILNSVGEVYTSTLYVEQLDEFMGIQMESSFGDASLSLPGQLTEGIRFEDVTFSYPGETRVAVENFNLTIPAGRMIALVGANGAGKSTLIKLLCRLYEPDSGRILIDGMSIRDIDPKELRRRMGVIFQKPVQFQGTAFENISIGDLGASLDSVRNAAREADAHSFIERLPKQYDTILGRLFPGGTELSGGQWQKVALARAFVRESPIVILDEPTSFMDSWSESEWLTRFRDWVRGRTTLMITHRFTTAMHADRIYVMDEGRIIESGTHDELLELNGPYSVSWRTQTNQTVFSGDAS